MTHRDRNPGHPIARLDAARLKRQADKKRSRALRWLSRLDDRTLAALRLSRRCLEDARRTLG